MKPCTTNENCDDVFLIRDWRGQCVLKLKFNPVNKIKKKIIENIVAHLLFSNPNHTNEEESFNVAGAYIPLCPFLKCYNYPPYGIGKDRWQNFKSSVRFITHKR